MVERQQLSAMDAEVLAGSAVPTDSEEAVLQWLAGEYGLGYTPLDKIEPDRGLLARFPARILLKEELLPLSEKDGVIEVAVSRLFATPGLDSLRAITSLKLSPILAPSEALQREIKKHPERKDTAETRLKEHERVVSETLEYVTTQALRDVKLDSGQPEVSGVVLFGTRTKWKGDWKKQEDFVLRIPLEKVILEFPFTLPPPGDEPALRHRPD